MIQHSLKMIWAERKSNSWIIVELIIVFSILWFCSGFIYENGKRFLEPIGFDINHTYVLRFDIRKNVNIEDYSTGADSWEYSSTIIDRLKRYPGVESCCIAANASSPYSRSYVGSSYEEDSINYQYAVRPVSPEYFDVFKIKFQSGKPFDSNEINAKNQFVASPDAENKFSKEDITNLKEIPMKEIDPLHYPKTDAEWENPVLIVSVKKITGVVNKIKRSEFENYERILFNLIKKEASDPVQNDFCVRVKPDADNDFVGRFKKEMEEQLKVGPYGLASVTPFSENRSEYIRGQGYQEKIETVLVIVSFLLINVFLGIVGTFRFRANARRGEIGLRVALGSNKKKIQQLLLTETFLMLFLASIPGAIIALNIQLLGIVPSLGISFLEETKMIANQDSSMLGFYLITYLITFLMMLIIIWLGTWYPAKKASEVQPAEALHYE